MPPRPLIGLTLSRLWMVGLLVLPISQLLSYPQGAQRRTMATYCAAVVAVGAAALPIYSLSLDVAATETAFAFLAVAYGIGCLASVAVKPRDEPAGEAL